MLLTNIFHVTNDMLTLTSGLENLSVRTSIVLGLFVCREGVGASWERDKSLFSLISS